MDLSPFWAAILTGLGASLWAVFTVTGRALLARLMKPFRDWQAHRRASAARRERMEVGWEDHTDKVDRFMGESLAARAATTEQFRVLSSQVEAVGQQMTSQDRVLGTLLAMTLGEFDASPIAKFVCDGSGRNTNVNAAYARLLGVEREDLLEFRWRSFLQPSALQPYLARFELANRDHYKFEDEIDMRRSDNSWVRLRVHLLPFPPDEGPATDWVGTLVPVEA